MKFSLLRLAVPVSALLLGTPGALHAVEAPATTAPQNGVVPLQNGDFALPKVPDTEKFLPGARAEGWTFDVGRGGGPGLAVEYWKKERPPTFFWNSPNGSISQTVDAAKFVIPRAGEVYKLSYFYGGQGKGKFEQTSNLLVDGQVVATTTHPLEAPKGGAQTPGSLLYTSKAGDVGKTIGVSFAWKSSRDDGFVQAALKNVSLSVAAPEAK